jgi:hypothetical protein
MAAEYPRVLVRHPAKKPECGRGFSPVAASNPRGKHCRYSVLSLFKMRYFAEPLLIAKQDFVRFLFAETFGKELSAVPWQ